MTSDKMNKILVLLASAQISVAELRIFVEAVQEVDQNSLEKQYHQIRLRLRRIASSSVKEDEPSASIRVAKRVRDDVISVARNTTASAGEASRRLEQRLRMEDQTLQLPVFSAREGFGRWVEKVIRETSASRVLNAAISEFSEPSAGDHSVWKLSE